MVRVAIGLLLTNYSRTAAPFASTFYTPIT